MVSITGQIGDPSPLAKAGGVDGNTFTLTDASGAAITSRLAKARGVDGNTTICERGPNPLKDLMALTGFAVQARYPDWGESLGEDDFAQALSLASAVVDWAAKIIETSASSE